MLDHCKTPTIFYVMSVICVTSAICGSQLAIRPSQQIVDSFNLGHSRVTPDVITVFLENYGHSVVDSRGHGRESRCRPHIGELLQRALYLVPKVCNKVVEHIHP